MEKLVLTLVNHYLWGAIIQPAWVVENAGASIHILEVAGSISLYYPTLKDHEKKIIQLAEKYSDKALMNLYSKEKTTSDFLKSVSQSTIQTYIRPCIEKYHRQLISVLLDAEVAFYLRGNSKERTLYEVDRIRVSGHLSKAVFHFIKDKVLGFRYFIQVRCENEIIDLNGKSCFELGADPAIVVVDKQLFIFEDIDAKKIIPFFTKPYIPVTAALERTYIEKFVV